MTNTVEYDATAHDIRTVTVFQVNRAEINRRITVQLQAGQNDVVVSHLPTSLDQDSLRVDGIGSATIFDVVYSPASHQPVAQQSNSLQGLMTRRQALLEEQQAHNRQLSIVEDYSRTLNAKEVDVSTLGSFLEFYQERKRAIYASLAESSNNLAELDREISNEQQTARSDDDSRKRGVKITIIVLADAVGETELSLSYTVPNASWTPLYDLRAHIASEEAKTKPGNPDKHHVLLHYRASISQSTGEDWNGVSLTLSTASPQLGSDIPTLRPYTLAEEAQVWVETRSRKGGMRRGGKGNRISLGHITQDMLDARYEEQMMDYEGGQEEYAVRSRNRPVRMMLATVTETSVSATFGIEGLSTIPSDSDESSETHKVSIAEITLEDVGLEWITVPKEVSSVFLQCNVKNTSQYPLLPGQASIYMGNSFVAKSSIPHVAPQESFNASLGIDGSVRVTYHPQLKRLEHPIGSLFTKYTTTTHFAQRISIKNARRTSLARLVVKDQLPVSTNAQIIVTTVEPRDMPTGPASAQGVALGNGIRARLAQKNDDNPMDGETGDGMMQWICESVKAGAAFDLNLVWEVTAPSGMTWGQK